MAGPGSGYLADPDPESGKKNRIRNTGTLSFRQSTPDLSLVLLADKERRKSDFLSHYQELTCRAALAIKTVDRIVTTTELAPSPLSQQQSAPLLPSPLSQQQLAPLLPSPLSQQPAPLLPSPRSPGAESVEFNEEEVLKTCQVITKIAMIDH